MDNKVNIKGICSITKKRKEEFSNYIKKILEIQKLIKDYLINKKEKIRNLNDTKNIITKPIAIVCSLIDKERHTDYISKIVLIQNEYKNKLSEVQRKEQISVLSYPTKKTPCYIDKKTKYIYHNLLRTHPDVKDKVKEITKKDFKFYEIDYLDREKLEKVYSQIFGAEDALVRPQIMSGTHAISLCLFGLLKYGDTMISITGAPYDTLQTVIGCGSEASPSSLKAYGIKYEQIELIDNDFD